MTLVTVTKRIAGVIEVYDDAVPNCQEVLLELMAADSWNSASVGGGAGIVNGQIRDNEVCWINPFDFRTPRVLFEFAKTVWHYIDDYGLRYEQPFSGMEYVNVNRYLPGQQYHVHADSAGGRLGRVISALVYLNDNFAGGETEFVHFDERIIPKAGRLIIFPSNYAYAHAALPPLDGVKYSAAFWTNA